MDTQEEHEHKHEENGGSENRGMDEIDDGFNQVAGDAGSNQDSATGEEEEEEQLELSHASSKNGQDRDEAQDIVDAIEADDIVDEIFDGIVREKGF